MPCMLTLFEEIQVELEGDHRFPMLSCFHFAGRAGYVGYLGPLKASSRKAPVRGPFKVEQVVNAVVDEVQAATENVSEQVDTAKTVG